MTIDKDKLKHILNSSYNKTKKIGNVKNVHDIKKIDLNNDKFIQPQLKKSGILNKLKNFKNIYFQQAEKINKSGKLVKFAGYVFEGYNGVRYVVNNLDKFAIKIDKNYNIQEIKKLDDFIKNMSTDDFEEDNKNKNEKNNDVKNIEHKEDNKDFQQQLIKNIKNLEKISNRFNSDKNKPEIVDAKKVALENIKNDKQKEFFEQLLKNFDDAEIYSILETKDKTTKNKNNYKENFLIKLNNDFIIYKNEIYYTGDIENADKKLNEPLGTIAGTLDVIGAEKLVKGIKDFLEGNFTKESQHIAASALENMLQQIDVDKTTGKIKKIDIYDKFLKKLNLDSISELTPIKAFYLFSQGEKLTGENLEKLKDLDVNKLKDLYIAQLTFVNQYLVNPLNDKNIGVVNLIQSNDINDYAKNSNFFAYTFKNRYDIYNKNPLIYKSILYAKTNIKCR